MNFYFPRILRNYMEDPYIGGEFHYQSHNIRPENVLFCYRESDQDSLEVANYYKNSRNIPVSNVISLPCSSSPHISYADFASTIEAPIRNAIKNSRWPIFVIILGFRVPITFTGPSGHTIACASRLQRIDFSFEEKLSNPVYDRKQFKFFDVLDSTIIKITAVIDAPFKEQAIELIRRGLVITKLPMITGNILFNPYGQKLNKEDDDYQNELVSFLQKKIHQYGLGVTSTVNTEDPYIQPIISKLQYDSFYWGFSVDKFSKSLFLNSNIKRVFLYNADSYSASSLRQPVGESDFWCNLAIQVQGGYATCAGAVSEPTSVSHLRPEPFFDTLNRGGTIGEAFLFASPIVNWKVILIGDPLISVNFPVEFKNKEHDFKTKNYLHIDVYIEYLLLELEEIIAWQLRQACLADILCKGIWMSKNLNLEVNLLQPVNYYKNCKSKTYQLQLLSPLISSFLQFFNHFIGQSLNQWLSQRSIKISQFLAEIIEYSGVGEKISRNNVHFSGNWQIEILYNHLQYNLTNIFFEIEVALDPEFKNVIKRIRSADDTTGWYYEFRINEWTQMPLSGFPSNYAGVRRVRYIANEENKLKSLDVYYVRWLAKDKNQNIMLSETGNIYRCIKNRFIVSR